MSENTVCIQPKVTVLVPIYNVQSYLRACLDTLVGQTLPNIEILCIDDGSTDECPQIIAEYAARDPRIRVITKPNSGYGDSMNLGIREAKGEWIGICEPDDFCEKDMYEKLVAAAERFGSIVDVAKANFREHLEGNRFDKRRPILGYFEYGVSFSPRMQPKVLLIEPSIWTAIYRRNMLVDNGISFSTTPGASFQDASFAHQVWCSARMAIFVKDGLYHYRMDNAASSSRSGAKIYAVCEEFDRSIEFLRARGDDELALFGPTLNAMRHAAYVWNYNRILPEYRAEFVRKWAADIHGAYVEGLLDIDAMTGGYLAIMQDVLQGPEVFCAKYPDDIPYPPIM